MAWKSFQLPLVLVVLAAALAGAVSWLLGGARDERVRPAAEDRPEPGEIEALRGQLERQEADLARFGQRLERRAGAPSSDDATAKEPARDLDRAAADRPRGRRLASFEERVERAARKVEMLGAALAHEPADSSWAGRTEDEAWELATAGEAGVYELECRTSFCRMEFSHPSPASAVGEWSARDPFRHGAFAYFDPNGGPSVIFFAREGHELPRSAPERR